MSITTQILILSVIAAVGVYCLFIRPDPQLSVNSTLYHPASIYQVAAANEFAKLKNRLKITVDKPDIINTLQREFPEITAVTIELPTFAQKPILKVQIAEPAFVLKGSNGDFIINSEGIAVTTADRQPLTKDLQRVNDQSGLNIGDGKRVVSGLEVSFINKLVAQSRKAKVPISEMTLPTSAQELVVKTSDQPYFVKFYLGGDPLVQIGQFLAARQNFDKKHQQPKDYLDVRVSGKIYFK